MDVQLDQLRTLIAVVDGGSFDAAARSMNVTPSAVSQRIKALEGQLGRVLVLRSKPARLTDSGAILMRLARQLELLERDTVAALDPGSARTSIPLVANADSLATWLLPAFVGLDGVCVDVLREDQGHSTDLLRDGTVMAAITSVPEAVQGCTVTPLGSMTYRPLGVPAIAGLPLESAPVVVFDRKDTLQDDYLRSRGVEPSAPPRHHIPGSNAFVDSVALGLGWGMVPDLQSRDLLAEGTLVELDPGAAVTVPLYWQQWALDSAALGRVAAAVQREARSMLR
ncbi:LysR family transcriptional regulator ArgP [Glaciihabitans arcticus]|uniref:LysR family transcriptional regulator ArgP n=1 Tax=Glaciihabitans arcticus TaxID=2668039 RepID=A0A4Q9GVS1_9MICO|nr:LysR family transcriptional regulator ArgP [Glaciihabitans arcticus]TBN56763.1 LysR family transcriptional regulator ArgP [Glaciihabitans arcticus]